MPLHPNNQFADHLAIAAGLHDWRAIHNDRRSHERMRVPPTITSISGTARAKLMSSPSVIGPVGGCRTPPWLMRMTTSAPSARNRCASTRAVLIGSGKVSAPD